MRYVKKTDKKTSCKFSDLFLSLSSYMKGVPFSNKRYMKGVPFLKNGISKVKGLDLGVEPPCINLFWVPPTQGENSDNKNLVPSIAINLATTWDFPLKAWTFISTKGVYKHNFFCFYRYKSVKTVLVGYPCFSVFLMSVIDSASLSPEKKR